MNKILSFRRSTLKGLRLLFWGCPIPFFRIPTRASRLYAKRFSGLTQNELRFVLESLFEEHLGTKPNLDSPKDFNEKLTWLKLHYHNPLLTTCADKVESRNFFLSKAPGRTDLLVRQFGLYDAGEDIDFDSLPSSFVLKSNWGSGCQIIIKDKSAVNLSKIRHITSKWQCNTSNHYYDFFEWGYKNIVPKIICEEFLNFEYKIEFYCFNGEPKFLWIVLDDKTKDTRANFYTLDWENMEISNHYPNFNDPITKPTAESYNEMINLSCRLSKGLPFVRCDFYKTKNGFRFSEMTFFHWGCTMHFDPIKYDRIFGDMITLPEPME